MIKFLQIFAKIVNVFTFLAFPFVVVIAVFKLAGIGKIADWGWCKISVPLWPLTLFYILWLGFIIFIELRVFIHNKRYEYLNKKKKKLDNAAE